MSKKAWLQLIAALLILVLLTLLTLVPPHEWEREWETLASPQPIEMRD